MYITDERFKHIRTAKLFTGVIYTIWFLSTSLLFLDTLSDKTKLITFIITTFVLFLVDKYNKNYEQQEFVENMSLLFGAFLIIYGSFTHNNVISYCGFLLWSVLLFRE